MRIGDGIARAIRYRERKDEVADSNMDDDMVEDLASTLHKDGTCVVGCWASTVVLVVRRVLQVMVEITAMLLHNDALHRLTLLLLIIGIGVLCDHILHHLLQILILVECGTDSDGRTLGDGVLLDRNSLEELLALLDNRASKALVVSLGNILPVFSQKTITMLFDLLDDLLLQEVSLGHGPLSAATSLDRRVIFKLPGECLISPLVQSGHPVVIIPLLRMPIRKFMLMNVTLDILESNTELLRLRFIGNGLGAVDGLILGEKHNRTTRTDRAMSAVLKIKINIIDDIVT
ncbi:hypothetical protein L207DRAFT_318141 [Hyaloscypha variabilis F]|uniref:Uncharacterized protein n=1 Tax=Hyaloscypha variabilis (strain UAMH 11265 / GT02V1 / F) TaxID=1149755 RepID=A0A2J6RW16_HYAVF|nr:hypothetical protein L207DRAFT_318141 [Hyaloscypha variabilis F]